MKLAMIRYNAGNVQSVAFALDRLGINYTITDDPETITSADKVLFPGVGEASSTMAFLKEKKLDEVIRSLKQPVLGICLGMQLLCRHSEENDTSCIGVFQEEVKKFQPRNGEKVPHMGWNDITLSGSWITPAVNQAKVYFVHSYYVPVNQYSAAITEYIQPFSAALRKDNFFGVQFHPEKSARAGELVLQSFLNL